MTDTSGGPARILTEDLTRFLSLTEGADSVELKLTVPDADQRSAIGALEMDVLDAEVRQVFFFDTNDLALNSQGLIVRARRTQKGDDSAVKLRPVNPSELPSESRALPGFGVEVDAMPGGFVCSARLKSSMRKGKVKEVVAGDRRAKALFDKQQRAFFAEHAPDGIGIEDLSIMGPVNVMKLKFSPTGYARRLVAELWLYPDGSRILELSTKCAPSEALQVAAQARQFLEQRGVDLSGEQQTKTMTALEFFSSELADK